MPKQDPTGTQPGDKVRLRTGPNAGDRGVVEAVNGGTLLVQLDAGGSVMSDRDGVTNYSLAARRAWEVMPKRAGRPSSTGPQKKMVSVRIDTEVWDSLGRAVERGLIPSREQAINIWLRERVDQLIKQLDS